MRIEGEGFELKPVFILREPLSRLKSAYALELRRSSSSQTVRTFEEFATSRSAAVRTEYEKAVSALDAVFGDGEAYYSSYESFFSKDNISHLCQFLGLDFEEPNFERVNAAKTPVVVDPDIEATIRRRFESTYDFAVKRFPGWNLEQAWNEFN